MQYDEIIKGKFASRPNRFIAYVDVGGKTEVCHVKNTGRCRELLVPGAAVYLEKAKKPGRKTKFSLVAVEKGERLINMDSQAPNKAFGEWVQKSGLFGGLTRVKPETAFGTSRFDFYLEALPSVSNACAWPEITMAEAEKRKIFVEVKGVTLEEDGVCLFPDAPTQRGVKHLQELCRCVQNGYEACVFFVVQMQNVACFMPNEKTHPEFASALREAKKCGVQIYAYDCKISPNGMWMNAPVKVKL